MVSLRALLLSGLISRHLDLMRLSTTEQLTSDHWHIVPIYNTAKAVGLSSVLVFN